MKTSSIWVFAFTLVLVFAPRARAATVATPLVIVNGTDFPTCVATNVGAKDTDVTVELRNGSGVVQTPTGAGCDPAPHTLGAGVYCFNRYAAGTDGYCVVSAKGKVRAALEVYDSGFLTKTVVPATK